MRLSWWLKVLHTFCLEDVELFVQMMLARFLVKKCANDAQPLHLGWVERPVLKLRRHAHQSGPDAQFSS